MRNAILVGVAVAGIGCGRSWIFDDTIETLPGGSSSGGHTTGGSGSTGRATGTSTGGHGTSTASGSGTGTGSTSGTTGRSSSGSSGGTTGSSRGTTGGSSSGGTTGGCQPGAAPNELSACSSDADCACPLSCVQGPGGAKLCEYHCRTLSDCPTLYTICKAGSCQPNLCGGGFGNGTLDGTCGVVGKDDGSCVPDVVGGVTIGLCWQGGAVAGFQTGGGACNPSATRADLQDACDASLYCWQNVCWPLCNPQLPVSCDGFCNTVTPGDPELGACKLGGTTGGSGSSGGGTSSGGSSGGATSGGSSSGGGSTGCPSPAAPAEFSPCQTQNDCGCPLRCTFDAWAGGQVCEYPCSGTSDCPDLVTICGPQGACNVNPCGQGTANGTFDGICSVSGTGINDGTCLPLTNDGGTSLGYCYQGGTSPASGCDPSGSRADLSRVCPAGQICFGGAITFGGTCNQICDPNAGGPCPPSQFCSFIVNEPLLGICIDQNGF
ncbi:MAG: hypothetical protein ACYDCL_04675 [Myxococcales bacterium]